MTTHEQQVLGSMLVSRSAVDEVGAILEGHDFYEPLHEAVFDAVIALSGDGVHVDPLSVDDYLARHGARQSHLATLHDMVHGVVTPAGAEYHARQVKAAAMRSTVRRVGQELMGLSDLGEPLEAVNAARERLDAVSEGRVDVVTNEVAVYDAIESMSESNGMPTPWPSLTEVIGGWGRGMLYVIGARPAVGKTVFGMQVVLDAARRGHKAVAISLEMPRNELYLRMFSHVGNVHGDSILHQNMSPHQEEALKTAAGHVSRLPMLVEDKSAMSIAQVRALVRAEQRKGEVGVVMIDYLTLMKPPSGSGTDRRVQVDFIAQGLKNLAKDLDVPIVALAQLNRAMEGRADQFPGMHDLRESGGIEAAADGVILLHRTRNPGEEQDMKFIVEKNRRGQRSIADMSFRGEFSRIEEAANQYHDGGPQ